MSWIFAYVFVVFCRHVAMLNKLMMMMMMNVQHNLNDYERARSAKRVSTDSYALRNLV